jgi:hypothetical protein
VIAQRDYGDFLADISATGPGDPLWRKTDHGYRVLLRVQRVRRRHRAAHQQQQLAAPHSMTSPARASRSAGAAPLIDARTAVGLTLIPPPRFGIVER